MVVCTQFLQSFPVTDFVCFPRYCVPFASIKSSLSSTPFSEKFCVPPAVSNSSSPPNLLVLNILKEEEERLEEMRAELRRMIASREAKSRDYAEKQMRGEMSAQAMIGAQAYIERMKELEEGQERAIEGQERVVENKKDDVENARALLVEANQELKALEKHKEKWAEKVKKERQAKEEAELDELAQTMYLGRNKD